MPSTPKELSIYGVTERLVDGVISLDMDEQKNKRFLYIRKMRETGVNLSKYEFSINANTGITIERIKPRPK